MTLRCRNLLGIVGAREVVQMISLGDKVKDDVAHEETLQRFLLEVGLDDGASSFHCVDDVVDDVDECKFGCLLGDSGAVMDIVVRLPFQFLLVEGEDVARYQK